MSSLNKGMTKKAAQLRSGASFIDKNLGDDTADNQNMSIDKSQNQSMLKSKQTLRKGATLYENKTYQGELRQTVSAKSRQDVAMRARLDSTS